MEEIHLNQTPGNYPKEGSVMLGNWYVGNPWRFGSSREADGVPEHSGMIFGGGGTCRIQKGGWIQTERTVVWLPRSPDLTSMHFLMLV